MYINRGLALASACSTDSFAGAAPTFVGAGTEGSATGADFTVGAPSGYRAGDILFIAVASLPGDGGGPPSGWSEVTNSPQETTTTGGVRLNVFWKRSNGGEGTVTVPNTLNSYGVGQMFAYRGAVIAGDPWDVTAGDNDDTSDTNLVIPTITTTKPNTLVIAFGASATDTSTDQFSNWVNANLVSITEDGDAFSVVGSGGGIGVASGVKLTAGVVGTTTADIATAAKTAHIVLALKCQ